MAVSGYIPQDLSTTAIAGTDGLVCALNQNEKYIPKLEGDLDFAQVKKPLEQIIADSKKNPPIFFINTAELEKTGHLIVTYNIKDEALKKKLNTS
jgi:hypothetical protein